jgi:hypothetical protein
MNHYIIGSKYGNKDGTYDDKLPEMIEQQVVATGFNWGDDMCHLVGTGHPSVVKYLKNKSEPKESYTALKHFLNLKPGDLIAVKIHSSPSGKKARLLIGAYAVVKGSNSPSYKYSDKLGHTIAVDYIETDLKYELPLGYGLTVHKILDIDRVRTIFGFYSDLLPNIESLSYKNELQLRKTTNIEVSGSSGYIVSRAHNKIQNALIKKLESIYGIYCIKPEKEFADVRVELKDKIIIFEVKSSLSADNCIRQAVGQILNYGWKLKRKTNKAIEYVIVGPADVDRSEDGFLSYIQHSTTEPLSYIQVCIDDLNPEF